MKRRIAAAVIVFIAVIFASGCAGKERQPEVIVVGSGLSGHAAVYSALDAGARVLWLEKQDKLGGSALIATGTFSAVGTELQKAKGIEDSVESFIDDVNRIGKGKADQDILRVYAEKADDVWKWFTDHGLVPNEKSPFIDPVHSPYSVARTSCPEKNSAFEYCRVLQSAMEEYKDSLSVMTSTEVTDLIMDKDAIGGVRTKGGKELRADAVILCTGGFGSNFDLIDERMPKYRELRSVTLPHADGSGILMAERAGADIINMDYLVGYFGAIAQEGTRQASFGTLTSFFADQWKGDVWVDLNGNRFIDEDEPDEDPRETVLEQIPEQTAFIFFDQKAIEANGGRTPVRNFGDWVEKDFGVKKADSLEELAESFGLPVDSFMNTVAEVNEAAASGVDNAFGKKVNMPLSTPPFYGVKSYGTIFMTQGGIKTSAEMQAIGTDGEPISGLYAAGEVQGTAQWGGHGMAGGSGTTPALVFGFEAGRNAVEAAR